MSLSSLIVKREIATMRDLEEALSRQVIYGGDLVTNLAELRPLDEPAVLDVLSEVYGLAPGPAGRLPQPDPEARRLVPAALVRALRVFPLSRDAFGLAVAVAAPLTSDVEQELSARCAVPVVQRIVTEIRLAQAIYERYGGPVDARVAEILASRGETLEAPSSPPPSEPLGGEVAATSSAPSTPPQERRIPTKPGISAVPPPPAEPAPQSLRARRRGPLTSDELRRLLAAATDRDAIFSELFAFARQFFEYSALLTVAGERAVVRDCFGAGATRERGVGYSVPLGVPGIVARARETLGPLHVLAEDFNNADRALLGQLERVGARALFVQPVVVRDRLVAALLGDEGDSDLEGSARVDLAVAASEATHAFERLIVARKRSGRGDEGPTPAAPSVEPVGERAPDEPATEREGTFRRRVATERSLTHAAQVAVAVRHMTNQPIPRQDDDEVTPRADVVAVAPQVQRPSAPPAADGGPALTVREGRSDAPRIVPVSPQSEQRIAVAAHRPPAPRPLPDALPSVIVETAPESDSLVRRVLEGEGDEDAEAELVRQGADAMPSLVAQFPGPITVDAAKVILGGLPRVSACGPILRVIARQRRVALPYVVDLVGASALETRFWATYLVSELSYPEAAPALVARLVDPEARVRHVARLAARAVADGHPGAMVDALTRAIHEGQLGQSVRAALVEVLGTLREPSAVPVLVETLAHEQALAVPARAALVSATRQDFGLDPRAWLSWWERNRGRHRIEWLIDALGHEDTSLRAAAGEELVALAGDRIPYSADATKRDRERAQTRYRQWWSGDGRRAFAR